MVGVFQSHAVTLDSLHHLIDGCILGNHGSLQLLGHAFQTDAFFFGHALCWHTCHHRDDLRYLFRIDHLTLFTLALAPTLIEDFQRTFQLGLTIAISGSQFKVLVLYGHLFLLLHVSNLFFGLDNLRWNLSISKMYA